MADSVILLRRGDGADADRILDAFAERTGMTPEPIPDGIAFAAGPDAHDVPVVQTLNEIDERWTDHLALQDPA